MSTSSALVPLEQIEGLSQKLAVSGLFAGKTKEQIFALLMLAQSENVHPMTAMRDFDIINGRPAKKAEAMHRSFIAAGGSIEWHALDETQADASFSHPQGGTARIKWDMEKVKRAEIKNEAMYKKYPRQMLRSRCISEGVRTVYPAATSGLYEPGEVKGMEPRAEKDITQDAEVVMAHPEQIEAMKVALKESGIEITELLAKAEINGLDEMPSADVVGAIKWIKKQKATS